MSVKITVHLKNYRCFKEPVPVTFALEPGKTIAIVGKNNVGKSALLRFFYEMKYALQDPMSGSWSDENNMYQSNPVDAASSLLNTRYELNDLNYLYPKRESNKSINFSVSIGDWECNYEIFKPHNDNHKLVKKRSPPQENDANLAVEVYDQLGNTLYLGAHRNLINKGQGGTSYFDLNVGSLFTMQWDQLKNGDNTDHASHALAAEELIADLLEWKSISINASADKNQLYIVKNNQNRFSISELGAGISELVICIVTAVIKKPSWILIDEPESHLHPALQIKFVDALNQLASHGVVFTTHSIGLARSCADSIFVAQQDKEGRSSLKPFEGIKNFSQLMGELAFSQMHELGFDKLLLCEGVTEVKTLRQILRLWNLDNSVMLIPLGGDALIDPNREHELEEFKRFNVDVFVIIDSERTEATKTLRNRDKFINNCYSLFGEGHAIQTERRATENYFVQHAIDAALKSDKYIALTPYQNTKELEPFWGKNNNWKIAAKMKKEDWLQTDVGQFIEFIAQNTSTK